jgi:hypothetical protein
MPTFSARDILASISPHMLSGNTLSVTLMSMVIKNIALFDGLFELRALSSGDLAEGSKLKVQGCETKS